MQQNRAEKGNVPRPSRGHSALAAPRPAASGKVSVTGHIYEHRRCRLSWGTPHSLPGSCSQLRGGCGAGCALKLFHFIDVGGVAVLPKEKYISAAGSPLA